MTETGVTLLLAASASAPRAARHGVVEGLALTGELASSTALLTSEAVTNSVLHGGLDRRGVVHVTAWWAGAVVHVEVCDEGVGLRSSSAAAPREGGHGLDLISHLSSRWGVDCDGRTRIWFELTG